MAATGHAGPAQYLKLPVPGGGTATWSSAVGTLGSGAGNTVASGSDGSLAARFSLAGSVYAQTTNAYVDVTGLGAGTYAIGSAAFTVDLNGMTFAANANSGQTVTFGAALSNSQIATGGGLSVSGGGTLRFDNTSGQYGSGLDLGSVTVDGSTVTLPASVSFGLVGDGSVASYSSIGLTNGATLVLGNGTAIGSATSSVTIAYDTGAITLAGGGAVASLTPIFGSAAGILSVDTAGGTLNVHGNDAGGTTGSAITLTVNDSLGTGTLNLFGDETGSPGGNDYSSANVSVAAGTLNLQLDTGDQSLGNLVMTGGSATGYAYTGDVTLSGTAQIGATNYQMNSLTLSGAAKFSGVGTIFNDLDLAGTAVFSPTSGSPTYVSGNWNANTGTPRYVASFDGTNCSAMNVAGLADASALQVDLLLAAGTFPAGVQNLTILTAGSVNGPVGLAPKWNIAGVYLDSARTIPATGGEIALSLTSSGTDLVLGLTIKRTLYVNAPTTPTYIVPVTVTTPTVTWSTPAAIVYGAALSSTQLNASASVAGTFVYSPAAGAILGAGSHTLTVGFTPTDTVDYTSATGTATLTVNQATPTVTWSAPAGIIAGTALSAGQLNATASVPGAFVYSPVSGTVLSAGSHTLSVTFTPTDAADYTAGGGSVTLTVSNPAIAASISLGSLNQTYTGSPVAATASTSPAGLTVAITYNGSSAAPTVAGIYPVAATITSAGYTGSTSGTLTIAKVTPLVSWAPPAAIRAGTPLSAAQLNASVGGGISGAFTYTPAAGALLAAAAQTLRVTFSPTDALDFTTVISAVPLTVVPLGPTAYFGSIGGGAGGAAAHSSGRNADVTSGATLAAALNAAQSGGTIIGYISSLNEGFVANFTLTTGGTFSVITPALIAGGGGPNLTLAGQVTGGVLSGTISPGGLTFSAALDPATGSFAAMTGAYAAAAVGSAGGSIYSIAGTQGDAFVLAVTPSLVTAGSGTLSGAGTIVVLTAQAVTITEAVNSGASSITGTVTLANGAALPIAGLASTMTPTNRLANLSARGQVVSGQNVLVSGFVIGGSTPETLLLRAVGPGLASFGVTGALANPNLHIVRSDGTLVAANAGWGGGSTLTAAFAQMGAFALSPASADAAVVATLPPGAYSMQVTNGGSGPGGIALAEIYEMSPSLATTRLVNLSSRGLVSAGSAALVGGFYVGGNTPEKVLIRGVGPTLAQFGIAGALATPQLSVYDGNGNLVAQNQSWGTPVAINSSQAAASPAAITAADLASGAFALPAASADSALIVTLAPGAYTAQLSGANGATGIGLIEVYETP